MSLRESWSLQRRARACHISGEPFADGDACHTAIFQDAEGNWLRHDYSASGWKERPEAEQTPFSHWRTRFEAPGRADDAPDPPGPLGHQSPEELLRQLCDQDEPHTDNLRFVLALMLERGRKLREQDAQDLGDHRILVYENPKSGELFLIRDPKLRLSDIDALQQEITALLESRPSPAADSPDPVASPPGQDAPNPTGDPAPDQPSPPAPGRP